MRICTPVRLPSLLVLVAALGFSACDSSDPDIDRASVPGAYRSTVFELVAPDTTIDIQALGGAIEMTLNADSTVDDGVILVPEGAPETDSSYTIPFEGTWTQNGDTLRFEHDADTFIRDIAWVYDGERITVDAATSEDDLTVVLVEE